MALRTAIILMLSMFLGAEPLPRGQVIARVAFEKQPSQSFSLYLPADYSEDRAWPVILGFSPGGNGEEPVRLFQKVAAEYGFIVVGSHDVRNGPILPVVKAQEALWKELHTRFRLDPKRVYLTGHSGGARAALMWARKQASHVAGILSFGAFGDGKDTYSGLKDVAFYLACGVEDFNHWELLRGREELRARKLQVMDRRFPGGHRWPKEDVAREGLEFMVLAASRRGLSVAPRGMEAAFLEQVRARARGLESTDPLQALRTWEDLSAWEGPGSAALHEIQRLAVLEQVKADARLEARYRDHREEARRLMDPGALDALLDRLAEARIKGSATEALQARRAMGAELTRIEERYWGAMADREWHRAQGLGSLLLRFAPDDPRNKVLIACAAASGGRAEAALAALRDAAREGYRNTEALQRITEAYLVPIKDHPDFAAIRRQVAANAELPVP